MTLFCVKLPKMKNYRWTGKVYFADTDAAGVVHHSQYLRWLEAARIDFFEALGFSYVALQAQRVGFVPHRIQAQYLLPLRFGDCFEVSVEFQRLRKASLRLKQVLFVSDRRHYQAEIDFACMDEAVWKIRSLPDDLALALKKLIDTP